MQIILRTNRIFWLVLSLAFSVEAFASQAVAESILQFYRNEYKDAAVPIKYVFTLANGEPCCRAKSKEKIYLLNIGVSAPVRLSYSPEIDALFKAKFEVEVDSESLISTPQADYIVLTMLRPAEFNKKYVRCAVGMGEERAYLVSIVNSKITVVNRHFGGCGRQYRSLREGELEGYEVLSSNGEEHISRYIVHGAIVQRVEGK